MQKIIIHKESSDVEAILASMGLTISDLQEAAEANFHAQASRTANDAPTASGFYGWNDSVRKLRESLAVKGWTNKNIKNSPRVVHPDNEFSIMFATGDEATGNPVLNPRTKSNKGATTKTAVNNNEMQANLFENNMSLIPQVVPLHAKQEPQEKPTWVFLIYVDIDETSERPQHKVRCELSLPVGMDESGFISSWNERIIIPDIEIDPDKKADSTTDEFAPEPSIVLERKK